MKPPARRQWNWRNYLTAEERRTVEAAERAKAQWLKLMAQRSAIVNRCVQRARFDAGVK